MARNSSDMIHKLEVALLARSQSHDINGWERHISPQVLSEGERHNWLQRVKANGRPEDLTVAQTLISLYESGKPLDEEGSKMLLNRRTRL